jgi:RNA-directed DNA polymerase
VDRHALRLIKLWLKAPIEDWNDGDGTRRIGGGKSNMRGTPQGGVAAPRTQKITSVLSERFWAGAGGACLI